MLSYECISLNNVQGLDFNLYATLITYLLHTHTKLDLIVRLNLMTKMKLILFMGIDLASYLTQIRNIAEFCTCWTHQSLKSIKINRAQTKMTSGDKSYSEKKYKNCCLFSNILREAKLWVKCFVENDKLWSKVSIFYWQRKARSCQSRSDYFLVRVKTHVFFFKWSLEKVTKLNWTNLFCSSFFFDVSGIFE